ncbi:CinA family protein [Zhihengliuella flava]|uniref:Nicotinamide-nucleotide amidase n=1 Tax=Zhihengliuella flava TaxID=1285193 RepID=A0A931GEP5_9MICC|nr:CinA family protein [Zhihengliuella flava]MBG6083777.1 nicotinamide-nucleotide amidase [Zhihengliuella flava]
MTEASVSARIVAEAVARGLTVATAESLTAGRVAAAIADTPGASAVLRGGVVSYASEVKASLLGVSTSLLARVGSVHPDVAERMAVGARTACGADVAVSTTGVAGPEAHDGQSVGTVYIGWSTSRGTGQQRLSLAGDRESIRAQATDAALQALLRHLVS